MKMTRKELDELNRINQLLIDQFCKNFRKGMEEMWIKDPTPCTIEDLKSPDEPKPVMNKTSKE